MKKVFCILLVLTMLFCLAPAASALRHVIILGPNGAIYDEHVTDVPIERRVTNVMVGQTIKMEAIWYGDNYAYYEGNRNTVTWTSGYPAVATVDANGLVTGHRAGQAHITATRKVDGAKRTVTVTVVGNGGYTDNSGSYTVQPTGIQTAGMTTISVGQTVRWTASVVPSNAANKSLYWASGYPAVATVDQYGNITGHRAGKAHITITAANGVKKTLTLTV